MNFLPGLLLLSHILLVKGDQYDYYDYYDYYDHDYCEYMTTYESDDYLCEDDFCMDKTQRVSVEFETEAPIRDTNLMEIDTYYEYFNVLRESGIRECSPSLEIKDFAECVVPCHEIVSQQGISWNKILEYRYACDLRRKGWINKDGSINQDIRTKYNDISGVSDEINECLDPERRQSGDEKKKLISFRREKTKLQPEWKGKTNRTLNRSLENRGRGIATKKCNRACKEERKEIMGFIDLDKLPSNKVVRQLYCVEYSVYRGLYYCMKDIIHGSYERPESTPTP